MRHPTRRCSCRNDGGYMAHDETESTSNWTRSFTTSTQLQLPGKENRQLKGKKTSIRVATSRTRGSRGHPRILPPSAAIRFRNLLDTHSAFIHVGSAGDAGRELKCRRGEPQHGQPIQPGSNTDAEGGSELRRRRPSPAVPSSSPSAGNSMHWPGKCRRWIAVLSTATAPPCF